MDPYSMNVLATVMSPTLGFYIHIPFCIQRCTYCDFATYSKDQIQVNDAYIDTLIMEINKKKDIYKEKNLSTIYFGGGTPSLLEPHHFEKLFQAIRNAGLQFGDQTEVTLEVNPATLNEQKCSDLKSLGFNRVSVGCQSFNDDYLKSCNREHSAQQTRDTIELIKKYFTNFSLDLLFSLPHQHLENLMSDITEILSFEPPHISAYCLTVPENHPMNLGRCSEQEQTLMFSEILENFQAQGLERYEISNFAKPGFESIHNNLYWTDQSYWGVGLSAHSYIKTLPWGYRFWNPSSYDAYQKSIENLSDENFEIEASHEPRFYEKLKLYESLSDFCHTHLRLRDGLSFSALEEKFGTQFSPLVRERFHSLMDEELVKKNKSNWTLTDRGVLLSNVVFSRLLFSQEDIDNI